VHHGGQVTPSAQKKKNMDNENGNQMDGAKQPPQDSPESIQNLLRFLLIKEVQRLSPEQAGRTPAHDPTFLQKYKWFLAILIPSVLAATGYIVPSAYRSLMTGIYYSQHREILESNLDLLEKTMAATTGIMKKQIEDYQTLEESKSEIEADLRKQEEDMKSLKNDINVKRKESATYMEEAKQHRTTTERLTLKLQTLSADLNKKKNETATYAL